MPVDGRHYAWKVMDLTHGQSNGTLNPDPTNTQAVLNVLCRFQTGMLPEYRHIWLLPNRDGGMAIREVTEDDGASSLDILWPEITHPFGGSFWSSWGVDNPVVELTVEERLFIALSQICVSHGYPGRKNWAASQIMKTVIHGKRRLSERYPYLVPDKLPTAFEDTEEYIRFLGQPVIDPGAVRETVNYLEF